MDNLQDTILMSMAQPLLQESSTFRDNLSNFLLNRNLNELDHVDPMLFTSIADELFQNLRGTPRNLMTRFTNDLIGIFNQPDWLTLTRVLQTMKGLPTRYPIDRRRVSKYLKEMKFTTNRQIDLKEFTKAVCEKYDPEGISVFKELNEEQRNIIEVLNQEQIESLDGFRSRSIDFLSKIMQISSQQRNIILSFTEADILMYKYISPMKIHEILNLDEYHMNILLSARERSYRGLRTLYRFEPKFLSCIHKVTSLTPEKMLTFKYLLQNPGLRLLDDEGRTFIRSNKFIEDEEIDKFKLKTEQQKDIIKNLNEEMRNALVEFDEHDPSITLRNVLKQAIKLGAERKDLVVLLSSDQLESILDGIGGRDLAEIAHMTPNGRAYMIKVDDLDDDEEEVLKNINPDQRKVLSKLYVLCPEGMGIVKELGPARARETLASIRNGEQRDFNIKQQVLAKRIERLSVEEKVKILNLSLEELITFDGIFQLEPISLLYIMNLSKEGIIVLKSMENYNADQIQFILEQSTRGLIVLAGNAGLNPTVIDSLRLLDRNKSGFLINLTKYQRQYLSTHRFEYDRAGDFFIEQDVGILQSLNSPQERELLSTISALTEEEEAQILVANVYDRVIIEDLDSSISRLFCILQEDEIHRMSTIFDWRAEEGFAFGLWKSLLYPDSVGPTVTDLLRTISNPVPEQDCRRTKLKFITSVIMAYRSVSPQITTVVENMATAIEDIHLPMSRWGFYVHLINYSIEDLVGTPELEELFSRIPDQEFLKMKLYELCEISDGGVPFLFRWMLVNPIERYRELSYSITRAILTAYSLNPNIETLHAILEDYRGIRGYDMIQSLRTQLKVDNYLLTHMFFFNPQTSFEKWKSITEWLKKSLTPDEQYEFLNSPSNYLAERSMSVLEFSLYHEKGCPQPFFEDMESDRLQELFDKHPVLILQSIVRNGYFETLQIFNRVVGKTRLMEVIRNSRTMIFLTDKGGFSFRNYRLEDLAQTIQWFAVEDSDPSFYSPIKTQLALEAKELSTDLFDDIMDILATDEINREEIAEEVRSRQPPLDGPSCARRRRLERSLAPVCIDSTEKEQISVDEKEHLMRAVFGNIQPEDKDFYRLMMSAPNEANLKKLSEKVAALQLDSVDSDLRDILRDIKNVVNDGGKVAEILGRSNVAMRIQKVAERAGLGLTLFLVGKHAAQLDFKSLGYDALNLWALPKLGSKVSEKLLSMGQRVIGPVLGRGIGNFGAFLGLADSIRARRNAQDPLDIVIADINIITNAVFISADIPALVTEVLAGFEIATGIVGEFAGPIGMAASVGVIVISESIEAAFKLNNISKQIKLTLWEEIKTYFKFLWDGELPDNLLRDSTVKNIYNHYLSEIIHKYQHDYGMMAISLPPVLITKGRYCEASNIMEKEILRKACNIHSTTIDIKFDLSLTSVTRNPFSKPHYGHNSRSVPADVGGFELVCGPRENDARANRARFEPIMSEDMASEQSKGSGKDILIDRTTEKLYIPQKNNADCDNILLYKNQTLEASEKMLFYLAQNASIEISRGQSMDVIFTGKKIFVFDDGIDTASQPQSKFYFFEKLKDCTLRKGGLNFLVIKYNDSFVCNLGGESGQQSNVAVIQGSFTDIKNIHRIIGSEKSDRIKVSHSAFVDGLGGNDEIHANNFTTVRSYYGDVIHGNTTIQLPMNVSEIYRIVADKFITVYNRNNQSVQVDAGSFLQTEDKFLIYPMKSNNETHVVTHLYVHKHIDGDVVLEDELAVLGRTKTNQFNCSMQITSRNYDITLSDINHSIFHADRNHHNFYWEAADGKDHLYMFEYITSNITISNAKGILDFSQFNHVFEDSKENLVIVGEQSINIGGLRVNLLNRQSIKVTFDGQDYYDIKNGRPERDYCPYSFKIDGRLIVDGQELFGHHNCFEFRSDKIIFYKRNRHLLLSSGGNVLTITNFYPLVHENLDVSLKLNSRVLGPDEFRKKASNPDPFRFYEIIEPGLTIHHNLPVDKDQIGVIHMNQSSILDHNISFQDDNLLLTNQNGISVTVVDWKKYQAAREIMFAFNDTLILNAECVSSTCTPESIIEEFQRRKQLVKSSAIRSKRNVHLEITGNSTFRLNNTLNAFKDNVNLVLLFVQNFLDKKYPLPQFPSINPDEVCVYATNITQSFQNKLKETSQNFGIPLKDLDCFDLYTNITEHLKNEEYSKASMILDSIVGEMFQQPL